MGTITPAQFAKECQSFGPNVMVAEKKGLNVAALIVKKEVQERYPKSGILRGLMKSKDNDRMAETGKPPGGAKIGVRYNVRRFSGDHYVALVKAYGQAHLLEWDTKAHRIPKPTRDDFLPVAAALFGTGKKWQYERRTKKKKIWIPGMGVFDHVNHPGTTGTHPWERGVAAAVPQVHVAWDVAVSGAISKSFGPF
jgi:hypothetical protein